MTGRLYRNQKKGENTMIRMGLVQAPAGADAQMNFSTLYHYARQAQEKGCCCVCFPEAFLTGYAPDQAALRSISRQHPLLKKTAALAAELGVDILTGFMEADGEKYYLCHSAFLADGRRYDYRKTHLGEKEKIFFDAGNVLPVFSLSCGIPAGIQLCVETHYPQITQTLSLRGAKVIFAPHAVPGVAGDRKALWEKYIPCRSYDNRVVMACCNLWEENRCCGGCLVTDARGEVTASCFENGARMLTFSVDPEQLQKYREENTPARYRYFPKSRRPELYD